MAEDAKAAEKRRLAEALRANLRRRKTATAKVAEADRDRPPAQAPAEGGDRG
jgi:hypothetical protein